MSLTARQRRALDSIEQQLGAREPRLASMFAMFAKLTKDELLPTIETIEAEPWHRPGRRHHRRTITRRRTRSGTATRFVNIALVPFIMLSVLVTALVVGGHDSPAGRCNRFPSYHSLGTADLAAVNCGSRLSQSSHWHAQ